MAYQRKTVDEFQVQQWTAQGWEEVTAEDSRRDAREQARCYRENQPEYPVRVVCKRVSKEAK